MVHSQVFVLSINSPSRRTRQIKRVWNRELETETEENSHVNAPVMVDAHSFFQPDPDWPFLEPGVGPVEDHDDHGESDSGFSDDSSISHSDYTRNRKSSTPLSNAQQTPACTTTPLAESAPHIPRDIENSPSVSVDPSLRQLLDETVHGSSEGLDSTQCASSSDTLHDTGLVQSLTHRLVNLWISAVLKLKETEETANIGHNE